MTDTPRNEEPPPKSSADLIREAREALSGDASGDAQASEDLMESAREWLVSNDTDYQTPAEPEAEAASSLPVAVAEVETRFEPRPSQTAPRRSPPTRAPRTQGPLGYQGSDKKTRPVLVLAVLAGLVALGGVAAALLVEGTEGTATVPSEVTISSTGSITSASDPCSEATISGDLEASITYWSDTDATKVTIDIIGPRLTGSDGTTYVLAVAGSATGSPEQETFVFDSEVMTMTRSDGIVIEDVATITVDIVGGRPDDWSYTSSGGACPG